MQPAKRLQNAGYRLVGNHSGVKLCLWCKKSIKTGESSHCYKQQFYGIKSHRCLQMSPALPFCNLRCEYCWRDVSLAHSAWLGGIDEPEKIIEGSIEAQKALLTGLGGVTHSEKHLREAMKPKHVAISLEGEPTMYPYLSELIEGFHRRGMTTFLVTNGTLPEVLEKTTLPTQLYVSLSSTSAEMFKKLQKPVAKNLWQKINTTLELLNSLSTRKVIRLTLIRNINMDEEGFSKLIMKAEPDFIEAKAFMSVGSSRQRIPYSSMPLHTEIKEFAEKLSGLTGYSVADEKADSRVVLLKK
ncbi:MAG: 4-demethylwyosine synthase TYW1 [Candidatus Aenigmatarchaeota archaeon]|nr:4-demethylwyosine synthase TYW1 [Candidatus Aenigmarchaeota archaeon]